MKRISILYFSAVGSTKVTAELLAELLARKLEASRTAADGHTISITSIEDEDAKAAAAEAGFLVLCYPTYYLKPAPPMSLFAAGLGPFECRKPCYILTTCELYSENSLRRLARILTDQGLAVNGWKIIRAPGSDVTAVLHAGLVPWLYRFGSSFEADLYAAAEEISEGVMVAEKGPSSRRLPPPRWYTPFTQLLQLVALNHFDLVKHRLRVLDERCTHCGLCVAGCPARAIMMGEDGIKFDARLCMLCCRCIHGCPEQAVILRKRLKDNRRIDGALLAELKVQARATLGLSAEAAGRGSLHQRSKT